METFEHGDVRLSDLLETESYQDWFIILRTSQLLPASFTQRHPPEVNEERQLANANDANLGYQHLPTLFGLLVDLDWHVNGCIISSFLPSPSTAILSQQVGWFGLDGDVTFRYVVIMCNYCSLA